MNILEISDSSGKTSARINLRNSQMFSLANDGTEFMWGGGRPDEDKSPAEKTGWQNSEIVMFPTIGASKDGRVFIEQSQHRMGQHGTARHAGFALTSHSSSSATFVQIYRANTKAGGPGYESSFPFDYRISKTYSVQRAALLFTVEISNSSARPMPFAVGWHPAFLIYPDRQGKQFVRLVSTGTANQRVFDIDAIKQRSKVGSIVEPAVEAEYVCGNGTISVASDLDYVQLWSPADQNQVCIEPISAPPDPDYEGELALKRGYRTLLPQASQGFKFQVSIANKV
jgi:galactose mutarotase-like enzyme